MITITGNSYKNWWTNYLLGMAYGTLCLAKWKVLNLFGIKEYTIHWPGTEHYSAYTSIRNGLGEAQDWLARVKAQFSKRKLDTPLIGSTRTIEEFFNSPT